MIAGLFFVLGVLAVVVVLGVLRNAKRREAAWERYWRETVDPDGAIDALIAASLRQAYSDDPPSDASIEAAIRAASVEDPDDALRLQRIRSRLTLGVDGEGGRP